MLVLDRCNWTLQCPMDLSLSICFVVESPMSTAFASMGFLQLTTGKCRGCWVVSNISGGLATCFSKRKSIIAGHFGRSGVGYLLLWCWNHGTTPAWHTPCCWWGWYHRQEVTWWDSTGRKTVWGVISHRKAVTPCHDHNKNLAYILHCNIWRNANNYKILTLTFHFRS